MSEKIESKIIMVAMCSVPELKDKEDEKTDGEKLKELLSKRKTNEG